MAITDSNPRQPYVDQHIYCLECKYDLFGLRTFTCPECGRPFDPADPKTWLKDLRHPFVTFLTSKRARRIALWTGIPILLLAIIELGADCGRHGRICVLCGATVEGWHFGFLGIGGDFKRDIREGPVSQFIQKYNRAPCIHQWTLLYMHRGGFFSRLYADGIGWRWFDFVSGIEFLADTGRFLQKKAEADPIFLTQFKTAYQNPSSSSSEAFLKKLQEEAMDWCREQQKEKKRGS